MACPFNRLLFDNKKKYCTCYMDGPCKHYAKSMKPVSKDHTFCDFIHKKCPEQGNL